MFDELIVEDDSEPPGSLTQPLALFSGPPDLCLPPTLPRPTRRPVQRLVVSDRSLAFLRRFYRGVTVQEWRDWHWQIRHRIRSLEELGRLIQLTPEERDTIRAHQGPLPVGITPYYASLISEHDPDQSLRRTVVPVSGEYLRTPGEADDPLGEEPKPRETR